MSVDENKEEILWKNICHILASAKDTGQVTLTKVAGCIPARNTIYLSMAL
jgi:hypothetical protein